MRNLGLMRKRLKGAARETTAAPFLRPGREEAWRGAPGCGILTETDAGCYPPKRGRGGPQKCEREE